MATSCLLFHGPGAREAALVEAASVGRLVASPFGEDGLKVDEAREIVSLLHTPPIGNQKGVLVVGPMDQAAPKVSDVLLKSIEEFHEDIVQPILWADDLGGVSPTIQSRCLSRWCPSTVLADEALQQAGSDLVDSVLTGEVYRIPPILLTWKGKELDLLRAVAEAISLNPEASRLWPFVRRAVSYLNVTPIEVVSALLQGKVN